MLFCDLFQVCHHPPISACHADSENFSFWQGEHSVRPVSQELLQSAVDVNAVCCTVSPIPASIQTDQRWKNQFWGKSLEIQPTGMVNVTLPR